MGRLKKEKTKKVKFSLNAPEAKKVALAGNFNKWNHTKTELKKNQNKVWVKELLLKPGRYEYKFVVDGNWIADPKNSNMALNSFGTQNSVTEV